ncbi:Fatty acyl-CoA reductase [Halioglobus japonicus]|nr:Fatty acyl-CoA reductase [Halioglobus japonicus]
MNRFDASSTTDQVIEGISLEGKLAVVTGASSGLGLETCRVLAAAGATVLMVARDEDKLEAVAAQLLQAQPDAQLLTQRMDLADLNSVRNAATEILLYHSEIQLLINNAGVMACPLQRTAQDFEMQFGTNHLGHFLFTGLLSEALLDGAPGRVINLSSAGHKFARFNFDDPSYLRRPYDKWQAYGESKTANVLFTVGLDLRTRERGVRSFAVHPGAIMTNLGRHMEEADLVTLSEKSPSGQKLEFKSVEQGAATTVWAASSPQLSGRGGIYLEDCQIAATAVEGKSTGVEPYAVNQAAADRLWLLSEELVGQSFDY